MGDQVLVASCAGMFYALDRADGAERWRFDIRPDGGDQFHSAILVRDDRLIFGTDGTRGNLHALSLDTGEPLWMRPCGKEMRTGPLAVRDTVIGLAKHDDRDVLFCSRIDDGTEVWTVERPLVQDAGRTHPGAALIDDGALVCVSGADGVIVAYDTRSGERRWEIDAGGPVSTTLLLHEGHLYGGTKDGVIFRVDVSHRTVDAIIEVGGSATGAPAVLGGSIGVLLDWRSAEARLVMLDPGLTEVRWAWTSDWGKDFGTVARLYRHEDTVLIGTQCGYILALDLDDGSRRWYASVDGAIRSFAIDGDTLLVGTIPGALYALTVD